MKVTLMISHIIKNKNNYCSSCSYKYDSKNGKCLQSKGYYLSVNDSSYWQTQTWYYIKRNYIMKKNLMNIHI